MLAPQVLLRLLGKRKCPANPLILGHTLLARIIGFNQDRSIRSHFPQSGDKEVNLTLEMLVKGRIITLASGITYQFCSARERPLGLRCRNRTYKGCCK